MKASKVKLANARCLPIKNGFIINGTVTIGTDEVDVSFWSSSNALDERVIIVSYDDETPDEDGNLPKYKTRFEGYELRKVLSFKEKMEIAAEAGFKGSLF